MTCRQRSTLSSRRSWVYEAEASFFWVGTSSACVLCLLRIFASLLHIVSSFVPLGISLCPFITRFPLLYHIVTNCTAMSSPFSTGTAVSRSRPRSGFANVSGFVSWGILHHPCQRPFDTIFNAAYSPIGLWSTLYQSEEDWRVAWMARVQASNSL